MKLLLRAKGGKPICVIDAAGFTALSYTFAVFQHSGNWHWYIAECSTGETLYDLGPNRRDEDAVQLAFLAVEAIDFRPRIEMARQFLPKLPKINVADRQLSGVQLHHQQRNGPTP